MAATLCSRIPRLWQFWRYPGLVWSVSRLRASYLARHTRSPISCHTTRSDLSIQARYTLLSPRNLNHSLALSKPTTSPINPALNPSVEYDLEGDLSIGITSEDIDGYIP